MKEAIDKLKRANANLAEAKHERDLQRKVMDDRDSEILAALSEVEDAKKAIWELIEKETE